MRWGRLLTALMAAGGLFFAAPDGAMAQEQAVPQPQQAVEVTDELVDRFVAVYPAVVEVAQVAQSELATAETPEEAQAIQAEAQTRIIAVLEEGGVTVAEYEAVVMRLNADPELLAEVQERLAPEDESGAAQDEGGADR